MAVASRGEALKAFRKLINREQVEGQNDPARPLSSGRSDTV